MGMNSPMVKFETSLRYISKKEVKKQEVLTVCIGDINGDGEKEIVFGGGITQVHDNLMRISKNTDSTLSYYRIRNVWKVSLILRYRNATDE